MPTLVTRKLQGYKAQLGYTGSGAMVIVAGLKDVEGEFTSEELDSTDHGNNGWKGRMNGLMDFSGTAKLDYIANDTSQKFLRDAMLAQTPVSITLLPVVGSGEDSFAGSAIITNFKWDGKNTDLQGLALTLKGAGPFTVAAQV